MNEFFECRDVSLKRYNTLRLNATAALVYLPLTLIGFKEVLLLTQHKKQVLIGKGSNILFTKEYYDDSYAFIVTSLDDEIELNSTEIIAQAGVSLYQLAWFCVEKSIGGYEFAEDIPGTVGGALIMNAGQYEFTIGMYVNWIDVYLTEEKTFVHVVPNDDFFTYRHSLLVDRHAIVLACGLKVQPGNYQDSLDEVLKLKKERYRKQPRNYPNAGSVFKRPVKDGTTYYVWKLFEEVGLRGFRIGDAEVSEKHPGFIVNLGEATQKDVLDLIQECKRRVFDEFGIELHLEWKCIE